ncbi:uncharacterized protein LOC120439255 isoform X1 [Oreochromis aureus]|uniref:uncharacterized protein LOC120439255 isoform X1 n=1 Tax=Oreochromis aureus TaxID=47969 RepID=UPI001952C004|nr:uncharacterized protein LOC120439255 isoform X1 [Oreochromis aureus]
MADPGSQPPAETSSPPPARSSDAGLRDFDPSLDPEVQEGEGEQDLLPDLERPEGKKDGADRALNKPPELHLHKGVTGEGHRRIGGQNLRAISHMTPAAAASPTTGPSVSGKRTMLLSNEARREAAKQARAVKEERRAALDARHKYLMSRLADAGSLEEAAVEDAIVSDDRFSLIHEFFAANGSKKLIFFYQDVKQSLSSRQSSSVDASNSAVAQRKLFLTMGNSENVGLMFQRDKRASGADKKTPGSETRHCSFQTVSKVASRCLWFWIDVCMYGICLMQKGGVLYYP